MRVLIVDDEEELVLTVVERLQLRGVEASGVTSGAGALEKLDSTSFDVVLLDVKMPGMGGLELLQKIRRKWPLQRVVLLTGHGSAELAPEGIDLGALAYLMKPVHLGELLRILRESVQEEQEEVDQ